MREGVAEGRLPPWAVPSSTAQAGACRRAPACPRVSQVVSGPEVLTLSFEASRSDRAQRSSDGISMNPADPSGFSYDSKIAKSSEEPEKPSTYARPS